MGGVGWWEREAKEKNKTCFFFVRALKSTVANKQQQEKEELYASTKPLVAVLSLMVHIFTRWH